MPPPFEGEIESQIGITVWADDREDEIDVYYVSPRWYLTEELFDFLSEKNWSKKGEYWEQNTRYAEACEYFDRYSSWYASGRNRQGAS